MPPTSKGFGAGPAEPGQPTQAPFAARMTGSSAVTRPPGLRRHSLSPSSGSSTRSTGSLLAATTNPYSPGGGHGSSVSAAPFLVADTGQQYPVPAGAFRPRDQFGRAGGRDAPVPPRHGRCLRRILRRI